MADAPNATDELYPIAVLIDELKVDSPPLPLFTHFSFSFPLSIAVHVSNPRVAKGGYRQPREL